MKKRLIITLCLALVAGLSGCSSSGGGGEVGRADALVAIEDFPILDGSTATIPLGRALMQYYTGMSEEETEVWLSFSTTDPSYYNLCYESADLLLVYEGSAEVQSFLESVDTQVEQKEIGRDALVFLLNENNPVSGLTTDEIQRIYTGEITNWSQVGGDNLEIMAHQRNFDSGSQTLMRKLVMDGLEMMDAPTELAPGGMGGLLESLVRYSNDANAIGYSVYYYVQNMYSMPEIKLMEVDGVMPSNQTIQSGEYPFVNPFYAVIRADEPEDSVTRQIFNMLTTDEGAALIEAAGYVSAR